MREADATEKMQIKRIADFLKKVLPDATSRASLLNQALLGKQSSSSSKQSGTVPSPASTTEVISPSSPRDVKYEAGLSTSYATPRRAVKIEDGDADDDDNQYIDDEVKSYGTRYFETTASPYLTPYV
jgi:hypothetical protein